TAGRPACSSWPGVTWKGSARPRRPISLSSPCSPGPRPGTSWTPWPGSSSGGRGRTAACCSTYPARRFPARTPRAHRGRVIPPAYRALVIRRNGDVLPTLLVDGYVAGVWRPAGGGIEATAFRELPERAWQELAEEARALVSFLAARDPAVYRRFAHW